MPLLCWTIALEWQRCCTKTKRDGHMLLSLLSAACYFSEFCSTGCVANRRRNIHSVLHTHTQTCKYSIWFVTMSNMRTYLTVKQMEYGQALLSRTTAKKSGWTLKFSRASYYRLAVCLCQRNTQTHTPKISLKFMVFSMERCSRHIKHVFISVRHGIYRLTVCACSFR